MVRSKSVVMALAIARARRPTAGVFASLRDASRTRNAGSHPHPLRSNTKATARVAFVFDWWWDGTPHQTTIESTESKRCGLLRTRANQIEKPAGTLCGRGRSIRFFALIGGRNGCSTSSAFRGQFDSQNRNRTRVPKSLSAGRTRPHGRCRAGPACRAQPVHGSAA